MGSDRGQQHRARFDDAVPDEDWVRLGNAVRERRDVLGLSQVAVQDRGGPSATVVSELENQRRTVLSPIKRRTLERALGWRPHSVDKVLAGGDPVLDDSVTDSVERDVRYELLKARITEFGRACDSKRIEYDLLRLISDVESASHG